MKGIQIYKEGTEKNCEPWIDGKKNASNRRSKSTKRSTNVNNNTPTKLIRTILSDNQRFFKFLLKRKMSWRNDKKNLKESRRVLEDAQNINNRVFE